ncbi:hypothetical protein Tco_0304655, partial [Tanacetum coccineum]
IDKLTKARLVGPIYNLLKGTCQSSIELEYNMEECYKALSDQLDWKNPKKHRCPFDLSKPLPLKGLPEKKYTTSITKRKAARYDVKVNKSHGYGHLEEIIVRRADRQLYTFKEGNFVDLHLNDIEDMLLLVVQHKLFQLDISDIVDLVVALRNGYSRKRAKRKPKASNSKHGVEEGKVKSHQNKENTTRGTKTAKSKVVLQSYKKGGTKTANRAEITIKL